MSKQSADGMGMAGSQADGGLQLLVHYDTAQARGEGDRISRTKNMCLDLRSEARQTDEKQGQLEFSEINIALFEDELKRTNYQRVEQTANSKKLPVIHTPKVSHAFAVEE